MNARQANRFSGSQHATDAATIEAWVRGATKGEQLTYCSAPELIRGEGSAKVGELAREGVVRTHQLRRAGGGWDFVIVRTGYALRDAKPPRGSDPLDAQAEAILAALKRAVNFALPCPSNAELARIAGLETRNQAAARVRTLIQRRLISSEQVTEDGATTRIVTIVGPDGVARTSLPPPRHLSALRALKASVQEIEG